jgi:hypothetical protein
MRPAAWWVVLAGCTGDTTELPPCEGGGDPAVAVGSGGADAFEPWDDGDEVEIVMSGRYGFRMDLSTQGLDTTSPMTLLVRFTLDGETESQDAGATLTFTCDGDGPGWAGMFVPMGDDHQTEQAVAALDGVTFALTASLVDAAGDDASAEGEYAFSF